jgi:anti-sigma factor RsiW
MMDCDRCREAMHEILDGDDLRRAELERHLAHCAECARIWRQLQRLDEVVRADGCAGLPAARREHVIHTAMARIAEERNSRSIVLTAWLRIAAAAALLLIGFGLGLAAGRGLWPRQVTVTEIVRVPEVREKIVRVEVPVVVDRPVVKHVPVVKQRTVYRPRPPDQPEPKDAPEPQPAPPAPKQTMVHYDGGCAPARCLETVPAGPPGDRAAGDEGRRLIVYGMPPDGEAQAMAPDAGSEDHT